MIGLPRRRRRVIFVLTPLIDVIFLLLIFFMLSSQIAPYSLMPIGRIANPASAGAPAADAAGQSLTLRVGHGFVTAGQTRIAIEDLAAAAEGFKVEGVTAYVLLPSSTAQVQDVVSVLEVLGRGGGEVTMLNARGAEP